MTKKDYFKKYQPIAYRVINKALTTNKLSHAYLFSGPQGALQKEAALYLFQSLVCTEAETACLTCQNCRRIANNKHADLTILDGNSGSIKKQDVLDLQSEFALTSLEASGKKMFLINQAEKMTREAMNSLLKFLEEPSDDVYGVLICHHEEAVLPTIKSRTQVINFQELNSQALLEMLSDHVPPLDAYFFAHIINDISEKDSFFEEPSYQLAKENFMSFIETFYDNQDAALMKLHLQLFNQQDKSLVTQSFGLFLEMLILFYRDLIKNSSSGDTWYQEHQAIYQNQFNHQHHLKVIIETKQKINRSINLPLLCDQMIYLMKEEVNE